MLETPPILTLIASAPRPTETQIKAFQGIETAHICDAMGGMAAMHPSVSPLGFGRDLPVFAAGPAIVCDNAPGDVLGTLAAIEHLFAGDILVHAAHGLQDRATVGDQVCGMLRNAGAAGFVTDGPMRDYDGIKATGLACWCTGLTPNSPNANGPATAGGSAVVGGRQVSTGDMIIADINGVAVVPFARIDEIIEKLPEVQRLEAELAAKVQDGFRTLLDTPQMVSDGRATVVY